MRYHKFKSILAGLALILVASSCGGSKTAETRVSVSGAFALYPLMVTWAEAYQAQHPGLVIDVSAGGAGKGMSDTLAGAVDIGMVSRSIAQEEVDQGAYGVAVTKDAVFGTISAANPYLDRVLERGITREMLAGIYLTGEVRTWGQVLGDPAITDPIHAFTRADSCGAAEMWVKFLGGGKQEELLGIGVNADPGVLEAVIKDPLGIGYNNLNYAYDISSGLPLTGAAVVPLDLDSSGAIEAQEQLLTHAQAVDAINAGLYPSPPARPLFLVTKGKPEGTVRDFIAWILGEGQQFVPEAGYIALSPAMLAESLEQVK